MYKTSQKICFGHKFCKGHLDTDLEDYEAVTAAATVDPDDDWPDETLLAMDILDYHVKFNSSFMW